MDSVDHVLYKLSKSKFRSSFHLKEKDINYIKEKGLDKIKEHAYDFLNKKIRVKLPNDGKQTPYHGHPVFISEHATATCCRKCIRKWYNIGEDVILSDDEIDYFVSIIMEYISRELEKWK